MHRIGRFVRSHRRGLIVLATGIGLLAGAAAFAIPYFQKRALLDAARRAVRECDFKRADDALARYSVDQSNRADVHLLAAEAARQLGAFTRAKEQLAAADRLEPGTEAVRLERALLAAQRGDPTSAEFMLQTEWGRSPERAVPILTALAQGYLGNCYARDAWAVAEHALKFRSDDVLALYCRGRAKESLHLTKDALDDYRRAVELAPRFAAARLRLATTRHHLGFPWDAVADLQFVRNQLGDTPEILLVLAQCRIDLGELPEAARLLDQLLARSPDHTAARFERARVAFRLKELAEAEGYLNRLMVLAPNDLSARRLLYLCLKEAGKDEAAKKCASQIERLELDTMRVNRLVARALDAPTKSSELLEVGEKLIALDRGEEGLPWLFAAIRADPRDLPARSALIAYLRSSGQVERARSLETSGGFP